MPFSVFTVTSPDALATALTATVTVFDDETGLDAGIQAAVNIESVVVNGGKYTIIDDPQIVNVSLRILSKGYFYTYILETV